MNLLHTADWHIGQTFFEYDRREEHKLFLEWLKEQIGKLKIDVLLIAGDVFDNPNPSADSQQLFYRFLSVVKTENPHLQVVIIAGNHDSAARLEAPNSFLEKMDIWIRGVVKKTPDGIDFEHLIVPLYEKGELAAYCLAIPYLRQGDYPESATYEQGVNAIYEAVYKKVKHKGKPIVAMGHLHAKGAEISENDRSERTIGGLESVSLESLSREFAYTALGHLHRYQQVFACENVCYAGAPLPMSFAEKNNQQGVVYLRLEGAKVTKIEQIKYDTPAKLLSIPTEYKPLSDVLEQIMSLPEGEITSYSPYLEIKVLIAEPEPSLKHQIKEVLKTKSVRLARIADARQKNEEGSPVFSYEDLQNINPIDLATTVYKQKYGETMPDSLQSLLQKVIREIR